MAFWPQLSRTSETLDHRLMRLFIERALLLELFNSLVLVVQIWRRGCYSVPLVIKRWGDAVEGTGSGNSQRVELHRAGRLDDAKAAYLGYWSSLPTPGSAAPPWAAALSAGEGGMRLWRCSGGGRGASSIPGWQAYLGAGVGNMGRWRRPWFSMRRRCGLLPSDARSSTISAVALLEAGRLDDAAEMLRLAVDLILGMVMR